MRHDRQIRNRRKRNKKGLIDLEITSLLDVLVILLIFLLNSYNTSNVVVQVPEGIKLPSSSSLAPSSVGVMIQVSPSTIWVDEKKVVSSDISISRLYDEGDRRILPLYHELVKKRQDIEVLAKSVKQAKPFMGVANLVIDKSLKYSYVKKLLYTCASAGYRQYKFVVIGEE